MAEYIEKELLRKAKLIYTAALKAVEPETLIKQNVVLQGKHLFIQGKRFPFYDFENIYLVSIGKAAPFLAKSLINRLDNKISGGIVLYLPQYPISLKRITCGPASHPLPDRKSVAAARKVLEFAKEITVKDLLFMLISGGGSSQLCLPAEGVTLNDKKVLTRSLLKAGADIKELNTVRKHLSKIKGGRLARAIYPGTVINLVISDVVNNDLASIASGPTFWDSTTYKDAFNILKKYSLWEKAPNSVKRIIENGVRGNEEETLKKNSAVFSRVHNFIIGDNKTALQAAQQKAKELGFKAFVLTSSDKGEARVVARNYVSLFEALIKSDRIRFTPVCLLSGGELTVTVRGKGMGGRNQEFILAVLNKMEKSPLKNKNWLFLSLGSDGIDGTTDAAGAFILPSIIKKAKKLCLDSASYLENNDSYTFFKNLDCLIVTGYTKTNVMDIRMFLAS